MKSDLEKISTLERKLNIQVPVETVKDAFDQAYKDVQKYAEVKGFRKGKAPLTMIRSMYKDRVFPDVVQTLIQTHYSKALNDHSLIPVNAPTIDIQSIAEDTELKFTASFEVRPDIPAVKYEGLNVVKEKLVITDEMVDSSLKQLQSRQATLEPLLIVRPAQKGDFVMVDFEGSLNGTPIDDVKGSDLPVEIGSGQFVPGFEDQILGLKIGDEKSFDQAMPADYHHKGIAGKTIVFKVKVKDIKQRKTPDLNDEFAKKFGKNTLEELKQEIRNDMTQQEQGRINEDFKKRLLKALVEQNPLDIPSSLKDDQKNKLVEDFKNRMAQQGMGEADYEKYKQDWEQDFEKTASFLVHSYFLVDKLARDNNLKPTEKDIEKELVQYAASTGIDIAELRKYYSNPDLRARLSYQLTETNVVKLVEGKATVKEVDRDKLPKD